MKLGILVNTDKNLNHILGITKAATERGHEVIIFNMDDGVKLFREPAFRDLCNTKGVSMSFCDHSTHVLNVSKEGIPDEIICGSQYNNAVMNHDADRVIVL
ncbi:DsrE family protein [Dissulfurispira sp.]|jgi:predicted peroxiredoxin|uniref:DsrE family protein n=1 Tax=Dissulfurispira sp. TaxID=2817609 RepID=UPI002FDA8556